MDRPQWSAVSLVNKEIEVENMAGSTFAAKRTVCDHVQSVGGIKNIDVSNKKLLVNCASARHKYSAYMEDQKKNIKGCCRSEEESSE